MMRHSEEGHRSRLPDLTDLDLRALADSGVLADPDYQVLIAALLRLQAESGDSQNSLLHQDAP
jgi:hypothetical protein